MTNKFEYIWHIYYIFILARYLNRIQKPESLFNQFFLHITRRDSRFLMTVNFGRLIFLQLVVKSVQIFSAPKKLKLWKNLVEFCHIYLFWTLHGGKFFFKTLMDKSLTASFCLFHCFLIARWKHICIFFLFWAWYGFESTIALLTLL